MSVTVLVSYWQESADMDTYVYTTEDLAYKNAIQTALYFLRKIGVRVTYDLANQLEECGNYKEAFDMYHDYFENNETYANECPCFYIQTTEIEDY